MFEKVIAALEAAEKEAADALQALWVPWDAESGSGAVFWHHSAAGALQEAQASIAATKATLTAKQPVVAPVTTPATTEEATAPVSEETTPTETTPEVETPAEETTEPIEEPEPATEAPVEPGV